jgi:hypothetical protein
MKREHRLNRFQENFDVLPMFEDPLGIQVSSENGPTDTVPVQSHFSPCRAPFHRYQVDTEYPGTAVERLRNIQAWPHISQ